MMYYSIVPSDNNASTSDSWGITHMNVEKYRYTWTIRNFSYLDKPASETLESPSFSVGRGEKLNFCLKLHLTGINDSYRDYLSLYVLRKTNMLGYQGQCLYTLSVLNDGKQFFERTDIWEQNSKFSSWGFPDFIKKSTLRENAHHVLEDDSLTIFCEIVMVVGSENFSSEYGYLTERPGTRTKKAPNYLEKFFLDEKFSDVKLIAACGKSLQAHKIVLIACSPVFEAMFEHDMVEKRVNEVEIKDAEYDVLKEMLRYVYMGNVEKIGNVAIELLKVADKYEINGLKELCEEAMCGNITLENVLLTLAISNQYGIQRCKSLAMNFIKSNIKSVIESQQFKTLDHVETLKNIIEVTNQ